MKVREFFAMSVLLAAVLRVSATPTTIFDTTPGGAVNDGMINVGEYVGGEAGVNSGFDDVVGGSSRLNWDSDVAGNLSLGIRQGGGDWSHNLVIYLDTVAGGFASTAPLTDTGGGGDAGRASISGDGFGGDASDIFFAPGFEADYAISVSNGFAGLFQLTDPANFTFVDSLNLSTTGAASADREMDFTLADIGLLPGDSFNYVGTYLDPSNAYRSNEGYGINAGTFPSNDINENPGNLGNFGAASNTSLGAGEFSTFVSVPEPSTMGLVVLGMLGILGIRRRIA